jgi:tRNA(Ile)-lysidine synthase
MRDDRPPESVIHRAVRAAFGRQSGRILVAVSGGADSLALLLAASGVAPARTGVASLDHGLRPEAREEVTRVGELALERGLAFHGEELGVRPGPGAEARARAARYAALERIARADGYSAIATAHTADDQAETLLMRLGRGAALRGAAGIQPWRGNLIRPLLEVRRADTEALVRAAGLIPVQDPTNADPTLLRARIRHQALPAFVAATGPGLVERLARFARSAQEDEGYLEELAAAALERVQEGAGLDAVALRALPWPMRSRVVRSWLEATSVPVSDRLLRTVDEAVERGGRTGLPGRRLLRSEGAWVRVETSAPGADPAPQPLGTGRPVLFGGFRLFLGGEPGVPVGWAPAPLRVRGRRRGDRVAMPGGVTRRVQDVLVDAAVPAEARGGWPLVVDAEDRVLWVVGLWPRAHRGAGPYLRAERLGPR